MNRLLFPTGLALFLFLAMTSCQTEESCTATGTCPEFQVERTDLRLSGEVDVWENQIQEEAEGIKGPVDLVYYGNPSDRFDFIIHLECGYTLSIRMMNRAQMNPWQHVGMGYSAYPGQDLNEKVRYVTAELRFGNEDIPLYSTNQAGIFTAGTIQGAFRITSCDEHQIKGRIRELVLYNAIHQNQRIQIDGTFIARVDFNAQAGI